VRRGVQGRGFSVSGAPLDAADRKLGDDDLLAGSYVLLQKGKRHYALVAVA
jgi:tyrosyl-tRNA synthetase